ncbi:Protein of unknown function [Pedococcus dokdonensis]|uniref:DUF2877 domain-containing protein n=1 Tax=Pedococcus dokdonensis TaxID=443156 RepID=A0A1H0RRS8_9MICO|nr:DUF2877 domain-containing protein [Pedococcus dokdonensis]SDP32069.1 Protein of unknown function [Pedococcus dokdonensis]
MSSPTTSMTTWPAAVSERSADLVHGAPRPATVLAAFPSALYLQVGGHADVLPVVTRGGLRLPTALTVGTHLPTVGWGAQPGDRVVVGAGAVVLPAVSIRAVRTWRPRRTTSRLPSGPSSLLPSGAAAPDAPWGEVRLPWRPTARALVETLRETARGEDAAYLIDGRVGPLVGAGPGLTPSGDDVLCGVLLGLRLHGATDLVDVLWRAVRPRLGATTSLSAALLREAADGYAVQPLEQLLAALARGRAGEDDRATSEAVQAVLAIGHTSGADLLGGLAGCLDALAGAPRRPVLTVPTDPARSLP